MSKPTEKPGEAILDTGAATIEIAIIDDDRLFSIMLQDYLLSSGDMMSEIFNNGKDFLSKYKPNDTRKIILDYEFDEGPDGLAILKKIKAINPLANVIIVSGQDDLEKAIDTLRKGATDYFLKTNNTVFANIFCSLVKIRDMEKSKLN
jgi:DNA-binding NtrC family response regulator